MTTLRYMVDGHGVLLSPTSAFYHLQQANQIQAIEIVEPTLWREVWRILRGRSTANGFVECSDSSYKEVTEAE